MSYQPRTCYTPAQLAAAEVADLETDLRCARRDGLTEYAEELEKQIESARSRWAERINPTPRFDGRCGVCNSDDHKTEDCPPRVAS